MTTGTDDDWAERLAAFASGQDPASKQAVPEPAWLDLSDEFAHVEPKGVERAVARFRIRQGEAVHADATLEGISYTLPEIEEVIGGTHVPGHTEGEELQVVDMKRASDALRAIVVEGPLEPGKELSDYLHLFIAQSLNIPTHEFRGDQRLRYDGPRVGLGRGRTFQALDARLTHDVLDAGLARIARIRHPLVRGATWAAFAAYRQFYFDGNKRAGRYTMNAVALSHGFDAIIIPATAKAAYEQLVVDALQSDDLTDHIRFLLRLHP
ncbi:MAG: hypothetical protein WA971_13170, partial [Microbacterium sp.]